MYPYPIIQIGSFELDIYTLCILIGFFLCLCYYRYVADRYQLSAKLQNLSLFGGMGGIILGYLVSVLFQAFYNYLENGVFQVNNETGATFYGGLIGGIVVFCSIYFGVGYLIFKDHTASKNFMTTASIAAGAISLAHAFGRIGCLFAGCCYGKVYEESHWFTFRFITSYYADTKAPASVVYAIPVQLYEVVFLLCLCAYLTYRLYQRKTGNFSIYMIAYAIWRFAIEYLRGDDRGATIVSFLSPSQLIAILFALVGVGIRIGEYLYAKKKEEKITCVSENTKDEPKETEFVENKEETLHE